MLEKSEKGTSNNVPTANGTAGQEPFPPSDLALQILNKRHRHRWEVNPAYVETLESSGLDFVGTKQPPSDRTWNELRSCHANKGLASSNTANSVQLHGGHAGNGRSSCIVRGHFPDFQRSHELNPTPDSFSSDTLCVHKENHLTQVIHDHYMRMKDLMDIPPLLTSQTAIPPLQAFNQDHTHNCHRRETKTSAYGTWCSRDQRSEE